ncbi:hypothetical protein D5S17_22250 [Pseudonocardiaceae bacterium YIM PH 21723]|nr:hypothetical protein D5S17_22250 [Pseudonocardiaceae bacterium YIM PH 21723]
MPLAGNDVTDARLVAIGDSLSHGFQSGAIFNTDLSYPAIIAHELGWSGYRYPTYNGFGGLPVNVELLLRTLETRYGRAIDWWEVPLALFSVRQWMDELEDYWERGPGSVIGETATINHDLSVYGWDLRDALSQTAAHNLALLHTPKDDLIDQVVENHRERAALRVYPTSERYRTFTAFQAAAELGEIETLIVFLGSNNALPAVTNLCVAWSDSGYDDLNRKSDYTVWRPTHFQAELDQVAVRVRKLPARHVIWCTVPHVTIAPITRGVGGKVSATSAYFRYYTRPWISEQKFDPRQDPYITGRQARDIDSAIDQYNLSITDAVRSARLAGLDWRLLDIAGILDRLAQRRYIDDPAARPPWWTPYELPPALQALHPLPDSRFLTSDGTRRASGGLFSLDGVHPTTVGYGVIAQELITIMADAGVPFFHPDGRTPRTGPIQVDWARLIQRDTLINTPPANIDSALGVLGWLDQAVDLTKRWF